jgi:hypothetical protein
VTVLGDHIARVRAGTGDARVMVSAFRDSLVLVPQDGGGAVAMEVSGVQWLPVFTTHAELAAWVVARGGDGDVEQNYLAVQGSRLLDVAIPDLGFPAGIAIDPAGIAPMMLPPVRGIVPDAAAVDVAVAGRARQ